MTWNQKRLHRIVIETNFREMYFQFCKVQNPIFVHWNRPTKTLSSVKKKQKNMNESNNHSVTRQHLQHFSASKSRSTTTTTSLSRDIAATSATETSSYQCSNTIVKAQTPVLFSTQRGLHLRLTKAAATVPPLPTSLNCSSSRGDCNRKPFVNGLSYDIKFCDLERWVSFCGLYICACVAMPCIPVYVSEKVPFPILIPVLVSDENTRTAANLYEIHTFVENTRAPSVVKCLY